MIFENDCYKPWKSSCQKWQHFRDALLCGFSNMWSLFFLILFQANLIGLKKLDLIKVVFHNSYTTTHWMKSRETQINGPDCNMYSEHRHLCGENESLFLGGATSAGLQNPCASSSYQTIWSQENPPSLPISLSLTLFTKTKKKLCKSGSPYSIKCCYEAERWVFENDSVLRKYKSERRKKRAFF